MFVTFFRHSQSHTFYPYFKPSIATKKQTEKGRAWRIINDFFTMEDDSFPAEPLFYNC